MILINTTSLTKGLIALLFVCTIGGGAYYLASSSKEKTIDEYFQERGERQVEIESVYLPEGSRIYETNQNGKTEYILTSPRGNCSLGDNRTKLEKIIPKCGF